MNQRFFTETPYALPRQQKRSLLNEELAELTRYHYEHCEPYRRMLDGLGFSWDTQGPEDFPFLPVRLFKQHELLSIDRSQVVKTMTSSGTTGQAVSKIFLDRDTSVNQQKALAGIVSSFLGSKRLPMLVLDTSAILKDRNLFSARAAGILGFSMFSRDRVFALDENMQLDVATIETFLQKYAGEQILLFGFTFMVWQHFYRQLITLDYHPDLSRGVLIHGGGWKKLVQEAVSADIFRSSLREACGLVRVHDYYGMVEQTGSIYMECEYGRLHTPLLADVIVRRPQDLQPATVGERGLIEVVSVLPGSYPGHALLTEDEGELLGEDDCACGRKGKTFRVLGRIQNAEIRGCSDTYAAAFSGH